MMGLIFVPQGKSEGSRPYTKVENEKIEMVILKAGNPEGIPVKGDSQVYLKIPFMIFSPDGKEAICERTVIAIKQGADFVLIWTKPGTTVDKIKIIENIKQSDDSTKNYVDECFIFLPDGTKEYSRNPEGKEGPYGPYYISSTGIYMGKEKISHYCYGCESNPPTTPPTTTTTEIITEPPTTPPTTITTTPPTTEVPTTEVPTTTTPSTTTITTPPTPPPTPPDTNDAAIGGFAIAALISITGGVTLIRIRRRK
jgi:hypothetical protein